MNFVIIRKKWVFFLALMLITGLSMSYLLKNNTVPALSTAQDTIEIHMVTGEFKTKTDAGKEIEAYRWDPGTIFVPKGQPVNLQIYGVNGKEHPFYIEGTDIKGNVKKGEVTTVPLQFDKKGIYRLICETHPTIEQNGPMIAYIVVE